MNHQILDSLIQDESIRSLLEKSADAYWLSEIYDYNGSVVILGGLIFANSPLCIHIS